MANKRGEPEIPTDSEDELAQMLLFDSDSEDSAPSAKRRRVEDEDEAFPKLSGQKLSEAQLGRIAEESMLARWETSRGQVGVSSGAHLILSLICY